MHEINIHTQRSDKYENKLGSVNRMRKTIFDRKFYVISLNDHISKVDLVVQCRHQLSQSFWKSDIFFNSKDTVI